MKSSSSVSDPYAEGTRIAYIRPPCRPRGIRRSDPADGLGLRLLLPLFTQANPSLDHLNDADASVEARLCSPDSEFEQVASPSDTSEGSCHANPAGRGSNPAVILSNSSQLKDHERRLPSPDSSEQVSSPSDTSERPCHADPSR